MTIATSTQRPFTAEIRRHAAGAPITAVLPEFVPTSSDSALWQQEVLSGIADIRRRLSDLIVAGSEAPIVPASGADPATEELSSSDNHELRSELKALEQAIMETKREIAALGRLGKPPTRLSNATDELDAVVDATEAATECILASSERIDEIVVQLRNQAASDEERNTLDEICEQVTRIFESCNFQDITGQRITKVVNAMKFIEERVERMIEIFGGTEAFSAADVAPQVEPEAEPDDESHLLEGPQLEGAPAKISQDDIDAFFN
ncbi:MAG: protein phosphatase CheZ [Rhodospirillales bacterium]|nr:protein phosphatase CheZ [Rhodospirillales bacterium]